MALRLSEGLGVTRRPRVCRRFVLLAEEPARTSVFNLGDKAGDDQGGRDDCRSAPVRKTADVAETQADSCNYTQPDAEVI